MILDSVLADRRYNWLGTERDKVAYFTHCLNVAHHDLPQVTFQSEDGERERTRYFPDKLPIGCERDGGIRHVFLYLVTRDVPVDFRMFLLRHGFFRERLRRARCPSRPPDPRFDEACRTYDAARFQVLYRVWYQQGDAALSAAASWSLQEALSCGEGRLEFVDHQYLHLSSLVGVA